MSDSSGKILIDKRGFILTDKEGRIIVGKGTEFVTAVDAEMADIDEILTLGAMNVKTADKATSYRNVGELVRIQNILKKKKGRLRSRVSTFSVKNEHSGYGDDY